MKALVIGRHTGEIPGIEIIETRAVTFPETAQECIPVLQALAAEAVERGVKLLLQNTPGQVAVACSILVTNAHVSLGVIISKPGPRPAGVQFRYSFSEYWDMTTGLQMLRESNPNCKTETEGSTVIVTVDPPMKFVYSHIEWF